MFQYMHSIKNEVLESSQERDGMANLMEYHCMSAVIVGISVDERTEPNFTPKSLIEINRS